jgi:NitT/TauT family transport system substrate-binding protein
MCRCIQLRHATGRSSAISRLSLGRTLAVTLLAALATFAASTARAVAEPSPAAASLVVAISPVTYSEIPIRYALQNGMFAKAGLDVQLQILANGSAIAAGVVGGSLDVGLGTVSGVISAAAHGLPVKLVAPAVVYEAKAPSILLLTGKQSTIAKAQDLIGKTIALSNLNDALRPATQEWLARNGLSSDAVKNVNFIEVPQSSMIAGLEAGRYDAIAVISPTLDEALASGKVRTLAPVLNVVASRLLWTGYFARTDWAESHRKTLALFLNVLAQATSYTNDHHNKMIPELATLLDQPPAAITHMIWPVSDRALDAAIIQPMVDLLARAHAIDQPFDANRLIFQP